MTDAKHSAGPWRIQPESAHPWVVEAETVNMPGLWAPIVKVGYRPNAHLIAAAPDLVAFARAALAEIDQEIEQRQTSGLDEYWQGLKAISDQGHAAVRKAEGRPDA